MALIHDSTLVSVIIPTYNRARTIERSINSVLNQTYKNIELIIVDDGSTDNTRTILNGIADKRLKYIKHQNNMGASAARNTGIRASQGQYIAFQDSDDEWLAEKLEKQMQIFYTAPAKLGVVYTGFWRVENGKKNYIPSDKIIKKEGNIHQSLMEFNFATTQAALVKLECFKEAGMFDENLPALEDWELWIRISKNYEFRLINEPLLIAYCQNDSISADFNAHIKARELILEKHFEDFKKENKKLLSKHLYRFGNLLYTTGKPDRGKEYVLKALKIYPLNIKCFLSVIFILFGSKIYTRSLQIKRFILGGL